MAVKENYLTTAEIKFTKTFLSKNLSSNQLHLKGIGQTYCNNTCLVVSIDIKPVARVANSRISGKIFIPNTYTNVWSYVKVQTGQKLPA